MIRKRDIKMKKLWTKEELMNREYLSVEQAAIYAGRTIEAIRQWLKKGQIESTKDEFGYRILIKKENIDARLAEIEKYRNRFKKDETEDLNVVKKDNE